MVILSHREGRNPNEADFILTLNNFGPSFGLFSLASDGNLCKKLKNSEVNVSCRQCLPGIIFKTKYLPIPKWNIPTWSVFSRPNR